MGVTPYGGSDGRGGTVGGGYIRLPSTEHGRTVYCDQAHYEPVSGGGEEAGLRVPKRWSEQYGLDVEGMPPLVRRNVRRGGRRWTGQRRGQTKLVGG